MHEGHGFARGLASASPRDLSMIDRMSTRGPYHVLKGGVPPLYPMDIPVGDADAEDQEKEGKRFYLILESLRKRSEENGRILDDLVQSTKAILEEAGVDLHRLTVRKIELEKGLVIPTLEIEVTEIDDILMGVCVTRHVTPDHGSRARGPGTATPGRLQKWASEQKLRRRMRKETGVLMDPVLHALLTQQARYDLMAALRKNPRSPYNIVSGQWSRQQLEQNDVKLHERITSVRVSAGRIYASVRLAEDVHWVSAPMPNRKPGVRLDQPIPDTLSSAFVGRSLQSVIDHPLIDRDWRIVQVQNNDAIPIDAHHHLGTDCSFVPVETVSDRILLEEGRNMNSRQGKEKDR